MGGMFSRPSMPAPAPPPPPPVVTPAPVVTKAEDAPSVDGDINSTAAADEAAMKRRRARSTSRTLASLSTEDTTKSVLGG